MSKKNEKQKESFEENLKRLEALVEKMEEGPPLEEALKIFEEGMTLAKKLEERLSNIERKVYEIKNMGKIIRNEEKEIQMGLFEE
ncbi:MAG: exodeoxyribonuclease VII small subunit [Brevinematia bacterium]